MWVAAVFVSTHIMSHMLANGQTENYFEFHMAQEHYANSEIKKNHSIFIFEHKCKCKC